jgi:phospholipid/cholesterol/gamma-HCH transport system ATP-binding protein
MKVFQRPQRETPSVDPVVRLTNIRKSFGALDVLKGISLQLHQNENLVILGRSGSGKSVLIKCIVGLIRPDEGTVEILGHSIDNGDQDALDVMRLQIGFSFQGSALYDSMTVRENLEFPLTRSRTVYARKELDELVTLALQEVGLEATINKMPSELSGGMKKRIGIARTLILKPRVMLYDEPTAGLDPITSAEINELILRVRERYNTSSIIITHDISCARQTSDRVIALINGQNQAEGTFEEVSKTREPTLVPFFNY